jgi:tRNA(Ile)-lysidine synthase
LLPHLRERYNPRVDESIVRLAEQAGEAHQFISGLAERVAAVCIAADSSGMKIDCGKLKDHSCVLVREVFKIAWRQAGWPEQAMGFDQWQQLAALAHAEGSGMLNLPGNIRAKRNRQFVIFELLAGQPRFP